MTLRNSRRRGRIAALSAAAAGLPLLGAVLPAFGQITIEFTSTSPDDTINTPQVGSYLFQVYGAVGGTDFGDETIGGYGAAVQGNYNFINRNLLQVYVGQPGSAAVAPGFGGGGGGGTFVYDEQANFLMAVAGGGGGSGVGVQGGYGQATTAGGAGAGAGAGAGGTGGNGGQAGSAYNNAAGGAGGGGYLSAGASSIYLSSSATGGGAYPGLAGGDVTYSSTYNSGGFGGGGGGLAGGGGGGGYSGGGGGTAENAGGGGGSYLDSGFTSTSLTSGGGPNGAGLVVITPSTSNLAIQYTGSGHIGGNISGNGAVSMTGTGICYLTGIDTYDGGTTISAGTLVVGDGNNYGSLSSNVTMSGGTGTLGFDRSDSYTFSGNISGSGTLTQIGTGTTILAGANSYSGQTTVSAGTLQLGNDGSTGLISGNITNNSSLVTDFSGSESYGGVISGTGSLTTSGSGVLYLTKQQTYMGATTIENTAIVENIANALPATTNLTLTSDFVSGGGNLNLNGVANNPAQTVASLSGDGGQVNLGTAGIFTVNQSTNTVFAGQIVDPSLIGSTTASGQLVKQGTGTLALTGANVYAGGTTISGGSLEIGNGGSSGSVTGNITDNANLAFDRTNTVTFSGNVTGSGSLTQLGTGTLVLTGTNTFTGGTTISAGSLQIGNGSSTGSITGNILDNANLTFDNTGFTTPGLISGSGSVTQDTGYVFLNQANQYGGNTVVNSGDLYVNVNDALPITTSLSLIGGTLVYNAAGLTETVAALSGAGDVQLLVSGATGNSNETLVVNQSANTVYSGTLYDLTYFGGSDNGKFIKEGSGTLTLDGQNVYGGGTTIAAGALVIGAAGALADSPVSITGGLLQLAPGVGGEEIPGLSITAGTLDITNNHLLIDYTAGHDPIATIVGYLRSGFNGGKWNGPGIISSTAQSLTNGLRYGVGWSDGADQINGHTIVSGLASGQIELKYTLLGDANLDGTVNGSDFSILAANFGQGYTNWDQGNFEFTPAINGSDFAALAANFGQGDSGADASVSQADITALDSFAIANDLPIPTIAAVPEPACAGLIAMTGLAALARRRRRNT